MGRIKNGYLKCPPGFKEKIRRRKVCAPKSASEDFSHEDFERDCRELGRGNVMEKKYVVPEGLKSAIRNSARYIDSGNQCLTIEQVEVVGEAVVRWLAENPILPSTRVIHLMSVDKCGEPIYSEGKLLGVKVVIEEWMRRMFLEPKPEHVEEVRDLYEGVDHPRLRQFIIEAYNRGKRDAK